MCVGWDGNEDRRPQSDEGRNWKVKQTSGVLRPAESQMNERASIQEANQEWNNIEKNVFISFTDKREPIHKEQEENN